MCVDACVVCVYIYNYVCVRTQNNLSGQDFSSLPKTDAHLKDYELYEYYIIVIIITSWVPL